MVYSVGDLIREHTRSYSKKQFLIYYDVQGNRKEYSYREFFEMVGRIVVFLLDEGIQKGDRILTVINNKPEQVMIYFAAWSIGACVVPINTAEDNQRILFIMKQSGAKIAFVERDSKQRIKDLLRDCPGIVKLFGDKAWQNSMSSPMKDWHTLINGSSEDEALIVYTSGTTGKPKGVILQQKNLVRDAEAIVEWHRMNEQTRMMCVLPIHHVNGTIVTLVTPLYCKGAVILNERFTAQHFWKRASQEKVHIVSVVPTLLEFLIEANEDLSRYPLESFHHFICGAGPLLVETVLAFEQKFNLPVIHGYGLSETTCYSSFLPIDLSTGERRKWLSQYGFPSIGVPIKYNEMTILNMNGREVQEGIRGEIAIRGETVMKEYDKRPEANAEAFRYGEGWFMSGDEGFYRLDENGRKFFFITGRLKELIVRGGVNISPLEIDEVLRTHGGVQYALTVPFENRYYGEEVGAYIVLKNGVSITENEILDFCKPHLPFFKRPKVLIFGKDIPYTSTGKPKRIVLKEALKEQFSPYRDVQFREGG